MVGAASPHADVPRRAERALRPGRAGRRAALRAAPRAPGARGPQRAAAPCALHAARHADGRWHAGGARHRSARPRHPQPGHSRRPTSVLIGMSAVLLAGTVGTSLGLTAGIRGGMSDHLIMRLADMQFAFPFILLAITVIGVLGPSIRNIILVVGLSNWATYARVVRAETLAVRERTYVDAARSLGLSRPRILWRHILPNVSASLIVVATFGVAGAILTEAGLSFLGLGLPPAIPS